MALLGLRSSLWWIVVGWTLHPLWDVGLHYLGPGRLFAPETYTIACLSFDLLVVAFIAATHVLRQRHDAGASPNTRKCLSGRMASGTCGPNADH
jgi:hypothetical protein